jgi:hypothetical protein
MANLRICMHLLHKDITSHEGQFYYFMRAQAHNHYNTLNASGTFSRAVLQNLEQSKTDNMPTW